MRRRLCVGVLAVGLAAMLVLPEDTLGHAGKRDWYEADDGCFIVSNSHHGFSKESAVVQSQEGLEKFFEEWRRDRHWSKATMRIEGAKATPRPSLRSGVAEEMILKPDVVTERSYTKCWEGVIWPYVCTSDAKVCRR